MSGDAIAGIDSVRRAYGASLEPEVAAWLMLAEGILQFSDGNFVAARDRIQRAHGLAVAMNALSARPSCAAWFAHIEFNLSKFVPMTSLIQEAFAHAESDDHQARSRAALVLADAFHFSGSFQQARPWYDTARNHATLEGDEATLSAMLHNMAAFRAANVRLAHALGEQLPEESHRASMEAASAANYDSAIGTRSFRSLIPLVSGQLLVVEGRLSEAMTCLSGINATELPQRLRAALLADLGWCAIGMSNRERAEQYGRNALDQLDRPIDDDDAAYVSARLSSLFQLLGDGELATILAEKARQAMERHRETQTSLQNMLRRITDASASPNVQR